MGNLQKRAVIAGFHCISCIERHSQPDQDMIELEAVSLSNLCHLDDK